MCAVALCSNEGWRGAGRGLLPLLAAVFLLSACRETPATPSVVVAPPADPRAALAEAARRWDSWRLQSYDVTVTISCFCPPPRSVRFEVRNGVSTAPGVDALTRQRFSDLERVELVFEGIRQLLDRQPARFEATYHPTWGHPTSYFVDRSFQTADDESGVSLTDFVPR
ncbi:MAG: DUF6174 domain-containing protein [Vicinamibacterales bacterium]